MGQDQVSGAVNVLCWHATPVANVLWKPHAIGKKSYSVIRSSSITESHIGVMSDKWMKLVY